MAGQLAAQHRVAAGSEGPGDLPHLNRRAAETVNEQDAHGPPSIVKLRSMMAIMSSQLLATSAMPAVTSTAPAYWRRVAGSFRITWLAIMMPRMLRLASGKAMPRGASIRTRIQTMNTTP